jgi:hypothetical protein
MIERVSWQEFTRRFNWKQGEHVTAIAPPGAGKTTLFQALLPYRGYNVMFGTKPDDPLYRAIIKQGYRRVESFSEIKHYDDKVLLWPRMRKTIAETIDVQREAFQEALDTIVKHGGWSVWIDESKYVAEMLGLRKEISFCVDQLRSNNSSVICGAQRPAWLPPSVLANATHVFLWKSTNREDQIKLADIGGIDSKLVRDVAKSLGKHEFIYIKTRGVNSHMVISQVSN